MGNRRHPRKALNRGYDITAQEVAYRATSGRYSRINASVHCHSSAINHGKRMPRDKPAVQAPTNAASGTQERRRSKQETPRHRIGIIGKTPSPPRLEDKIRPAKGVARACTYRRALSSCCSLLTCLTGLTFEWSRSVTVVLRASHFAVAEAVHALRSPDFNAGMPRQKTAASRACTRILRTATHQYNRFTQQLSRSVQVRSGPSPPSIHRCFRSLQLRAAHSR